MKALVRHIRETGMADRLYACLSLDRLVISIYEDIAFDREAIKIRFDLQSDTWELSYLSQPSAPEVSRTYAKEAGFAKFDTFISMLRW